MDEYRRPAECFPVTDVIVEEMKAREWSHVELARKMCGVNFDMQKFQENYLILGFMFVLPKYPGFYVGQQLANDLASAFGTGADLWLNLDKAYKDWLATTP